MLNIAICDDSQPFLTETVALIRRWPGRPAGMTVCAFSDADALIEAHAANPFDVILLDVVMPLLGGIEAAAEIRRQDRLVKIVFLSASPEFAVDSYRVKADNYLLKPADPGQLYACLDELSGQLQSADKALAVKSAASVHRIPLREIEYLESQGKVVLFCLADGRTLRGSEPLYAYEDRLLPEDGFFKCHRSYLVNLHKIRVYTPKEIVTTSGCRIPISRSCHKDFEATYFATLFGKAGEE